MILSNLSVPLLGLVDTAVVGHLESPVYLGAVAVGASIFMFIYIGVNFLRMGTTGIVAQCYGADNDAGVKQGLAQALVVALLIAATLLAAQVLIGALALAIIKPSDGVREFASVYFSIRIWSAPATLCNYALIGWFLGVQNARVPLYIVVTTTMTNIVLDLVFVTGLGMTADGVALASVIAEYTGFGVGSIFAVTTFKRLGGRIDKKALRVIGEYRNFASINSNLFLRTMALMFAFFFVTAQSARFGDVLLAANAILLNLQTTMAYGLDGLAHAAEALVGRAVGTRRRDAVRAAVSATLRWSLGVALLFSVAYFFWGKHLIALLTDQQTVIAAVLIYLPWLIVSPVISVWSFLYDGVFVGATLADKMRNSMLISTFFVFLPVWYLTRGFDNHGLWFAFMMFMAARGLTMHLEYRRYLQTPLR